MSSSGSPRRTAPRLRVGQWLGLTIGVLLLLAVASIALALLANHRLNDQREVVLDQVQPALLAALRLENALVNEETGVRGYIISADLESLQPYESGRDAEALAYRELERLRAAGGPALPGELDQVRGRAQAWQLGFVAPTLQRLGRGRTGPIPQSLAGKRLFDALRVPLDRLHGDLNTRLADARAKLSSDAALLQTSLLIAAGLILGSLLGAGLLLRSIITRPLAALGRDTQRVAAGSFDQPVAASGGAREIVDLGDEIESMRERIVAELAVVEDARAQLEAQALELTRSNSDLEQFAYVASHDLQEPLRKIASFCQALQRRYEGQLDERADQYIEFAVDGAKRMQTLINDLLAFSRVGRSGEPARTVELDEVLAEATASLSRVLRESGASVSAGPLPRVRGERTLLVSLFGNLIGNAVKFRGADPPVVRLAAERDGGDWRFSCIDNGIGVDPEYADRIFVIFQRLHGKDAYPGTGIGLAMCRKIVEHLGGRMWLEPAHRPGAEFRFTLPIVEEDP